MELLILWVMFWGVTKGIEYAAQVGGHDAKAAAGRQWRTYRGGKAPATRSGRVGRAVGRTVSSGWHGAKHGAHGTVSGWRQGWPEGKQIAHDRHEAKHTTTTPDGATVTPIRASTEPAGVERPPGMPVIIPSRNLVHGSSALAGQIFDGPDDSDAPVPADPEITIYHNNGRWERHTTTDPDEMATWEAEAARQAEAGQIKDYDIHRPDGQPRGLASVTPIAGGADMSIATATGGEVTTYASLIAELETVEQEAVADLEDAVADAQRAKENAARFEAVHASLASLKLDDKTLGEIASLREASTARLKASEGRQSAAEQTAMTAETARKGVQSRHAAIQEHADVMAERDFYQG